MLEFLKVFDRQVEHTAAAESDHVRELKEELLPAVERARAKRPGLVEAWKARNQLVNELNSHEYPNGLPQNARRYLADLPTSDPVAILDNTLSEFENITFSQFNDPLNRWPGHPVDPNRRQALCVAIRIGLQSANLTDSILRNVEAVKEALAEEARIIAAGYPSETPVIVPPLPARPQKTVVDTQYRTLRR